MLVIKKPHATERDRSEAFRAFARRRAAGEVLDSPLLLPKHERRLHVRETLREDHRYRIENHPEGAQAKFDKLATSPFTFFRGTALLYYRDYAGTDAQMPFVFTIGDIHPENFGVMPNEDGAPFFGINDFDEAGFAPFTYDVKRGAVGFYIVAKENGLNKKKRRKVVRAWVKGYLKGLRAFAQDDRERWFQYRIDNSPPMIRDLLKSAQQARKDFLAETVDLENAQFIATDEVVPYSKHLAAFQEAVDTYKDDVEVAERDNTDDFFKVKDVAVKKDSGTASLGLDRYFVLIEGPSDDPTDDLILEFKQARRSVLIGLVPPHDVAESPVGEDGRASADIVRAHEVHLAGGDPFYGRAVLEDRDFLVRERSPFKDDIDVDDLNTKGLKTYARICGEVLAQTHARSDEDTGVMDGEAETQILAALDEEVFTEDVVRFAKAAAKRVYKDFKAFKKDHALDAFNFFQGETG